eukprot:12410554-Karenia_brevis.AAC.1
METVLDLGEVVPTPGGDSLGDLIDKLQALSPARRMVTEVKDMGEDNFVVRDRPRPSGYLATSRFHVGRMCVPVLH